MRENSWVSAEADRWRRLPFGMKAEELGRPNKQYMTRIHLTPWEWWPFRRLYLHVYHRPDEDPDPHDHPFGFRTIILLGGYVEAVYPWRETAQGVRVTGQNGHGHGPELFVRKPGHTRLVLAGTVHKITSLMGKRTVTLVIRGPKEQDWGFYVWDFKNGPVKVPSWKYIGLPEPEKSAYE
jgi:hypothetical protein